jgi:hypothetical protein
MSEPPTEKSRVNRTEALIARWFPMAERKFLLLGLAAIVVIRLAVILATPRTADFNDPRIYQGVGQTVLAGVNPYDYTDKPALRAALRAKMSAGTADDEFTQTQKSWDYYVSGNLPASTALYAAFEAVAHGSRFVWRLLFILGDAALFLTAYALLKTLRGRVDNGADQAALVCLAIINPVLIVSGCAIPEDKQFQTALLLWVSALLLARGATTAKRGLGIGFVLSLSVLFKLLGIFLLPLWVAGIRRGGRRFAIWTVSGSLVPVVLSFALFGHYFVNAMLARGVSNSVDAPEHSSPWVLVPWIEGGLHLLLAKIVVNTAFCGVLIALLSKRRIDLLNFCAGLTVAFTCLWLDKGAMNRMDMAIIFAVASLASLSRMLFLRFCMAIVLVSGAAYLLGVGLLKIQLALVDAALVSIFLVAYLICLAQHSGEQRVVDAPLRRTACP